MAESSEGKHILRSVDQVGVARNERKDHLSKSEHPKGAMGWGIVMSLVGHVLRAEDRVQVARNERRGQFSGAMGWFHEGECAQWPGCCGYCSCPV